ncbi:AAA-like domain-containing protein [Leptolyngbya sp. AN03gr2]|uniref:AAA-like domain-containing protein n=1 Tax=unclassified Leptolyngbya TaxID=2650499 RepID=UPI003D321B1C
MSEPLARLPQRGNGFATHYFLLLLNEQSAIGELVLDEIQLVKQSQQIAILPICVDLSPQFQFSFDLLNYLRGVQLWQWHSSDRMTKLTEALLQVLAERRIALPSEHELAISWDAIAQHPSDSKPLPVAAPEIPGGQVDLNSRFYIDRPPIESLCHGAIEQPGCLIRIRAPRQMGKTSLMARILQRAEQLGDRTVVLSFQLANQRIFRDSDTFLLWFCSSISLALGMFDQEKLMQYWQLADVIGSNQCCKAYLEEHLLAQLETPLTLGLDEVDRVFESLEIADDFFGLLRVLHEEAKRRAIWKKLRLVLAHSTEVYIPLDVNKSPFNVGLAIELPEFNAVQIQELIDRHGLNLSAIEQPSFSALLALVSGHPYLVRVLLYYVAQPNTDLNQILQQAATEAGIFRDHLQRHLRNLEAYPELLDGIRQLVLRQPLQLPSKQLFKLNSMGLVNLQENQVTLRCELYHQYFQQQFSKRMFEK